MIRAPGTHWTRVAARAVVVLCLVSTSVVAPATTEAAHLKNTFQTYQCTWWVVERLLQTGAGDAADTILGWAKPRHAFLWRELAKNSGWASGTEPRVGAIAWWPKTRQMPSGHVAYVEELLGSGKVRVSESNFGPEGSPPRFDRQLTVSSEVEQGMQFIYPPTATPTVAPTPIPTPLARPSAPPAPNGLSTIVGAWVTCDNGMPRCLTVELAWHESDPSASFEIYLKEEVEDSTDCASVGPPPLWDLNTVVDWPAAGSSTYTTAWVERVGQHPCYWIRAVTAAGASPVVLFPGT